MIRSGLALFTLLVTLGACVSVQVSTMQPFKSADGRFTVTVPAGTMKASTLAAPSSGAFAGSTIYGFSTGSSNGARLAVLYADTAPGYLDTHGVDAALADAEQANLASNNGTLVSATAITVAGQRAREDRVIVGDVVYDLRLVFIGQRFYTISVTGSTLQVDAAEAKVFLDSFSSP